MEEKEFNKVLDRYIIENKMASVDYENLTDEQRYVIQCLKRAFKRINKTNETKIYD